MPRFLAHRFSRHSAESWPAALAVAKEVVVLPRRRLLVRPSRALRRLPLLLAILQLLGQVLLDVQSSRDSKNNRTPLNTQNTDKNLLRVSLKHLQGLLEHLFALVERVALGRDGRVLAQDLSDLLVLVNVRVKLKLNLVLQE